MSNLDTLLAEYRAVNATAKVHLTETSNAAARRSEIVAQIRQLGLSYAEIGRLVGLTRTRTRQLALRAKP